MLSNAFYIIVSILILGAIILFHELGHFIVGRLCGIGVVEFSIGFGPKLFGWRGRNVDYSVRALLLGGYCRFLGEDDDASSPNSMFSANVYKRIATVAAGPVLNFLVAYIAGVVAFLLFAFAVAVPTIDAVEANMPAAVAGIEIGDKILAVNGEALSQDSNGVVLLQERTATGEALELTLRRGEEELTVSVTPSLTHDGQCGQDAYKIGVIFDVEYGHYTLGESLRGSFLMMKSVTKELLDVLRGLIFRFENTENVTGFVGTVAAISETVQQDFKFIWDILFVISLNLGIMNLLPFPGLDGARLLFLIAEAITGKRVPPEKEGLVHGIGLMLLLALAVVLMWHDIRVLIFH